jgi:hypothetical protein
VPDEKLGAVYRVEVTLERDSLKGAGKTAFKAGKTATADIVIRRRRIADVLLAPIRQLQKGGINLWNSVEWSGKLLMPQPVSGKKVDRSISAEQVQQIVVAIKERKYSWACVLILRFACHNPLQCMPCRTAAGCSGKTSSVSSQMGS